MALKIPPPPQFSGTQWQTFNRWLIELQSILSNQGGIDPSQVAGLSAVITQVGTNTSDITTLEAGQGSQGGSIAALQAEIGALQTQISTINGEITTLSSRNQVLNGTGDPNAGLGNVGDWYGNLTGAAGHRIFIKTASATWTAFPF